MGDDYFENWISTVVDGKRHEDLSFISHSLIGNRMKHDDRKEDFRVCDISQYFFYGSETFAVTNLVISRWHGCFGIFFNSKVRK